MAYTNWQQRIVDLESGSGLLRDIEFYDGTQEEFEADPNKSDILQGMSSNSAIVFRTEACECGGSPVDGTPNIAFYDGTKEELESNSEELAKFLEGVTAEGLAVFIGEKCSETYRVILDATGSKVIGEKITVCGAGEYLPLTGGTLTGAIQTKRGYIDSSNFDGTVLYDTYFEGLDKNGFVMAQLYSSMYNDGALVTALTARRMVDGSAVNAFVMPCVLADGKTFVRIPTYDKSVKNELAAANKAAVSRDFVSKDNNEIVKSIHWDFDPVETILEQQPTAIYNRHDFNWRINEQNANNYNVSQITWRDRKEYVDSVIDGYSDFEKNVHYYISSGLALRDDSNVLVPGGTINIAKTFSEKPVFYVPAPIEGLYNNQADTLASSINRHPMKIEVVSSNSRIYIGGSNASDTANLWQGRGTSPEMPFASLLAARNFAYNFIGSHKYIEFVIQDDITAPELDFSFSNLSFARITSLTNNIRKITGTGSPTIFSASESYLSIQYINLDNIQLRSSNNGIAAIGLSVGMEMDNPNTYFLCANNGYLGINGSVVLTANGTCGTFAYAGIYGRIMCYGGSSVTGSVVGKRYHAEYGGQICVVGKGANFFPGTTAGTCDENSKYF